MNLPDTVSASSLAAFTAPYKSLLHDRRLCEGFDACVWGIIGSGSCKVSQIAASNPFTARTEHGERSLRRLLHGDNKQADVSAEALGRVLTEQGAKCLKGEHEVLLVVDESDLRKPFASELEHLDTVRDLEGKPVAGFHTLSILGIGATGQRALLYQTSFSTNAPGFRSVNDEYRKAMLQVSRALREKDVGRLLWVMDRGFDDSKLLKWLHARGECFVVRSKHPKRQAKVRLDGPTQQLQNWLDDSRVVGQVALEQRLFTRARGKAVAHVEVRALSALLKQLPATDITAVQLSHLQLAKPWLLLSNLRLPDTEAAQLALAARIVQAYRQRWSIEDLFAWTKDALDWESVRLLSYSALCTLVSFAWVAAAFIFHVTDSLKQPQLLFLARLGGWTPGNSKPGKAVLSRGLARLSHFLVVQQHLGNPDTASALHSLIRELRVPDSFT